MPGSVNALPAPQRRILIAGVSGVGKSTLALRVAEATGHPYTEIDSLYHGPSWTPRAEFVDEVRAYSAAPCWVTEWQYRPVRELLLERADTLVWLDLPVRVAMSRVVLRTVRRSRTKQVLWNGNTEPGLWHAITDPEGIIRWAVKHQRTYRRTVPEAASAHPHLQLVRLRSQSEVEAWLAGPLSSS